jgi:hypothetical protein
LGRRNGEMDKKPEPKKDKLVSIMYSFFVLKNKNIAL